MSHQLICTWLGLPADSWPPDHYRLLGLQPGEADVATIEQHVQERLDAVRRYQLTHPEQATEAMNRLAQAFVCLTDPESKRAYDAALLSQASVRSNRSNGRLTAPPVLPAASAATQLDLSITPGPAQSELDTQIQPAALPTQSEPALSAAGPPEKPDPVVEAARLSRPARRGLGTKRALYHRIARTRQLLRSWEAVGKYLSDPARKINRPAEAIELIDELTAIRVQLANFPPLLGAAGQPGYLVVSLARQHIIVPTFQTLLPSQREALARDWKAGWKLLLAHRDFLRQEVRALRRRGFLGRALRAIRTVLTDQPGMVLLLLALLALNVALWRQQLSATWISPSRPQPTESAK